IPVQHFGRGGATFRLEGVVDFEGKRLGVELRSNKSPETRVLGQEHLAAARASLLECVAPYADAVLLQFDTHKLAEPSQSKDEIPELAPDGSGLASVLADFKLSDEERFDAIERALCSVVPSVTRLRVARRKMRSGPLV